MTNKLPQSARPRFRILLLLLGIIAAGVISRSRLIHVPHIGKEIGDVLFATMFYFLLLLARPKIRRQSAGIMALAITFAIEFLKLYHSRWMDALRADPWTGFLLGHNFYWRDLGCYVLGAGLGILLDVICLGRLTRR